MYSIGSVFIVNRDSQVTGYFLQDLEVHVFWEEPSPGLPNGTVCATHIPPMGVTATLQCEAPVIGRYLRIYRRSSETVGMPKLVFCEVEVYGRRVATCGVITFKTSQGKQAICDKTEVHYNLSVISCSILCLQSRVCMAYNYVRQTPVCELIYDISVIDRFEASAIGDFYELISE
ncbi:uncharacterized protein LOC124263668 [Haliotis rubra]|uniref:uncharacterized protein LOC124263668 n=1 Tax=Haliotis rubra TaxID=36100 RepID=UPI001EE5440F|nr:uncharacterized protein LOC124263668 [Haliotis rubra]